MENPGQAQAQEAHELARERIAAAKENGERVLNLSAYEVDFDGKTYPGDKRFEHLASLPPEIAGLTALQSLGLEGTQIAGIKPLAKLEELSDLRFSNIPACAADPKLAKLSEIEDDEERTRRTLAYLRGEEPIAEPKPKPKPKSKAKPEPKTTPPPVETAPFQSDQPATQDLLNRRAVAETLGTIVDEVWNKRREAEKKEKGKPGACGAARDRTFIVHLHGRWGSGKTSILNFLCEVLLSGKIAKPEPKDLQVARDRTSISRLCKFWGSEKTSILNFISKDLFSGKSSQQAPNNPRLDRAPEPPWVIVDYNAWRNQGLGPAWWTLMDTVYREAAAQLGGWSKDDGQRVLLRHNLWRFGARWLEYVGVLAVAAAVVFAVFQFNTGADWLVKAKNTGVVVAVLAGVIALLNRLSIGTARTAKQYMELTRDPMTPLIGRYSALIEDIGRPVAVFIDDLDRCDAKFVVELLQNIQTMFRSAPVLYVVAADRGWICTSYEQVYQPYCEPIAEPGHSLGHMFLEKIFQLSIEVPALSPDQRKTFWNRLLETKDKVTPPDREAIDAEVTERLKDAKTEQEVIDIVDDEAKLSPERGAIAGARAFQRMQSKELVSEREHFLAGYVELLDANPRAMKRLLNAYGFRRGFDIQSPDRSDPDALVRWTILENRWPVLADHLAGRSAGRGDGALMDALMQKDEVQDVGEGLTWKKLRTIAGAPTRSGDGKLLPGRAAKKA